MIRASLGTRLAQLVCGLRGHDSVLYFDSRRVLMRCPTCGHDSPGWTIGGHAPRQRYVGDPRRLVTRRTA